MGAGQFTKKDQEAAVGHILKVPMLYPRVHSMGVTRSWFTSPVIGEVYEHLVGYTTRVGRSPNTEELRNDIQNKRGLEAPSYLRSLESCVKASESIGFDDLSKRLVDWSKGQTLATNAVEIQEKYNLGDHKAAYALISKTDTALRRLDVGLKGDGDELKQASFRLEGEAEARFEEGKEVLSYGISLLDDMLVGIPRNSLIIVGARTGAGKTEFAKIVAKHNVALGNEVAGFFLEAEDKEIERRIKYGMLMDRWRLQNEATDSSLVQSTRLSYADWRLGRCRGTLDDPFGKLVDEEIRVKFDKLKTYYRSANDFNMDDLERQILLASESAKMIILDHLHYVDLDPKNNEIQEITALIKRLRDLAQILGIPILCIAHLRKGAGATLVPTADDFYGSSNITKNATTCITMSSAAEEGFHTQGIPTFMRATKFRLDGARTKYVGISFYDRFSGMYEKRYSLGHLNMSETKWSAVAHEKLPSWSRENHVPPSPTIEGKEDNG